MRRNKAPTSTTVIAGLPKVPKLPDKPQTASPAITQQTQITDGNSQNQNLPVGVTQTNKSITPIGLSKNKKKVPVTQKLAQLPQQPPSQPEQLTSEPLILESNTSTALTPTPFSSPLGFVVETSPDFSSSALFTHISPRQKPASPLRKKSTPMVPSTASGSNRPQIQPNSSTSPNLPNSSNNNNKDYQPTTSPSPTHSSGGYGSIRPARPARTISGSPTSRWPANQQNNNASGKDTKVFSPVSSPTKMRPSSPEKPSDGGPHSILAQEKAFDTVFHQIQESKAYQHQTHQFQEPQISQSPIPQLTALKPALLVGLERTSQSTANSNSNSIVVERVSPRGTTSGLLGGGGMFFTGNLNAWHNEKKTLKNIQQTQNNNQISQQISYSTNSSPSKKRTPSAFSFGNPAANSRLETPDIYDQNDDLEQNEIYQAERTTPNYTRKVSQMVSVKTNTIEFYPNSNYHPNFSNRTRNGSSSPNKKRGNQKAMVISPFKVEIISRKIETPNLVQTPNNPNNKDNVMNPISNIEKVNNNGNNNVNNTAMPNLASNQSNSNEKAPGSSLSNIIANIGSRPTSQLSMLGDNFSLDDENTFDEEFNEFRKETKKDFQLVQISKYPPKLIMKNESSMYQNSGNAVNNTTLRNPSIIDVAVGNNSSPQPTLLGNMRLKSLKEQKEEKEKENRSIDSVSTQLARVLELQSTSPNTPRTFNNFNNMPTVGITTSTSSSISGSQQFQEMELLSKEQETTLSALEIRTFNQYEKKSKSIAQMDVLNLLPFNFFEGYSEMNVDESSCSSPSPTSFGRTSPSKYGNRIDENMAEPKPFLKKLLLVAPKRPKKKKRRMRE